MYIFKQHVYKRRLEAFTAALINLDQNDGGPTNPPTQLLIPRSISYKGMHYKQAGVGRGTFQPRNQGPGLH